MVAQQGECGDRLAMSALSTGMESGCQGLASPGINQLSDGRGEVSSSAEMGKVPP